MQIDRLSRRDFGKIFAVAAVGQAVPAGAIPQDDQAALRDAFTLDPKYIVMHAANLCPAIGSVNEILFKYTRDVDANPSPQNRNKFATGREETRKKVAAYLNAAPEEIVITR